MGMRGWLVYSKEDAKENRSYIGWFIEEARLAGLDLLYVPREDLTIGIFNHQQAVYLNNEVVKLPDFAVLRTIEPMLSEHLEALGVPVFNSSRIARICNDKALTHHHVHRLGIPMADTVFIKKENLCSKPPLTYPFVVKDTAGRGGRQVYMITNEQEWLALAESSDIAVSEIILQTCDVQLGKDLRVFVVGEQIVGAVLRESSEDFRSNFKLGGSARWYELSDSEIKTIRKIIDHFHFDMAGIDFLIGNNGELLFNEIEDVVGSRMLSTVSDINILQQYVAHIKRKLSMK